MSVFRNNPRPNESEPNRFGEAAARTPEGVDLLGQEPRESARPSSSLPAFAERETRGPTDAQNCPNVIASGAKWNGSLSIDDSVRIDGQVAGEIVAKGTIHISEGARVDAKLTAAFVVISGSFKGEARCSDRLELLPKSRVEGQLVTKVLNVHEGAVFDGSIQMTTERDASARTRDAERNGAIEAVPEAAPARPRTSPAQG